MILEKKDKRKPLVWFTLTRKEAFEFAFKVAINAVIHKEVTVNLDGKAVLYDSDRIIKGLGYDEKNQS
jgi:hypothetical protein